MNGMSKTIADRPTGTPPGRDDRREPQHHAQVEDVAAGHVPDRHFPLTPDGGHDGGRHLGQGRTDRHHGQADHQVAHPEGLRHLGRTADQPPGPEDEQAHADDDEPDVPEQGLPAGSSISFGPVRRGGGLGHGGIEFTEAGESACPVGPAAPARHDDEDGDVDNDEEEEHEPVDPGDRAVQGEDEHQDGRACQHGDVRAHQLRAHGERQHQRRRPEYEQDIGDVAAHHVAQRDTGTPGEARVDRHGELRRAGRGGDDGESHDERRHPECACEAAGPADE